LEVNFQEYAPARRGKKKRGMMGIFMVVDNF